MSEQTQTLIGGKTVSEKPILPNDAINKAYDEYLENIKNDDKFDQDSRESIYCGCGKDISEHFSDFTNEEIEEAIHNSDIIKSCGGQFCMP